MTVSELYSEVSQLGFETSLDDSNRFYQALNRCLLQAFMVKPVVKQTSIAHFVPKNIAYNSIGTKVHSTEDIVIEAVGAKSFAFEISGNCKYLVEFFDEDSWKTVIEDSILDGRAQQFSEVKGFVLNGSSFVSSETPVRIVFKGDYFFLVRNIAMYGEVLSDDLKDIPSSRVYQEYDLSSLIEDFGGLVHAPTLGETNLATSQYKYTENSRLAISKDIRGLIDIEYYHKPNPVEFKLEPSEDKETEIDLDFEVAAIFPYLIASYVWVDDEPAKAQYYRVMYDERAYEIKNRYAVQTPIKLKHNGW